MYNRWKVYNYYKNRLWGIFNSIFSRRSNNQKRICSKSYQWNNSWFQKRSFNSWKISSFNNPYIINLIKYGESQIKKNSKEKSQYIILEYASKGEFLNYIDATDKGLEEKYAKFIFGKILDGVLAIHKSGLCPRDLKMDNILLD